MWSAMPVFLAHPHTFVIATGAAFAYITVRLPSLSASVVSRHG
jgi:hypothetical protein